MEELLFANGLRCYEAKNWEIPFTLQAFPGERIFIHGTKEQCDFLFEVLSGLRRPDEGSVNLLGKDPYSMAEEELAAVRRENIGAIPQSGGFLPELTLLDQLLFPLRLSGKGTVELQTTLQETGLRYLEIHHLYNPARRCSVRTRCLAALLRSNLFTPQIILMNGTFDGLDSKDTEILWQETPKLWKENRAFLYLSSAPVPLQAAWTRELRMNVEERL